MWKKLAIISVSAAVLNACAGPISNGFESARLDGLKLTPLSKGACDGIGQLIPGPNLSEQFLTLAPQKSSVFEASAAPSH